MSKGDLLVERGARGLEQLSRKAAAKGGFAAKISDELADDAAALGCAAELELVEDLLEGQTGAQRQLRFWDMHGRDLKALVREMVADTRA